MEDTYCTDCKKNTPVVFDHAAGDTICLECGLVLEAFSIDETCEWRSFADDDNDPNRIGSPVNPLLTHGALSTVISKPAHGSSTEFFSSVTQWKIHGSTPDPDRTLIAGFSTIATMCDRLNLVATIKNRASEIYKKVEDQKTIKGRKNKDAILAACVYYACKQEQNPRTPKEICSVANGATEKEITRAMKSMNKQMELGARPGLGTGVTHAEDFVARFCSHLGVKYQTAKAVQEAVKKSSELLISRNPTTVAATMIYMITQLSNERKPLRDIGMATGVAVGTIRKCYKDLSPHAARLVPTWYAQGEVLKNLTAS